MPEGEFTEEELEQIQKWDARDPRGLFEFLEARWRWPDYIEIKTDTVSISTGGWSGHEEALGALEYNTLFMVLHWEESKRGGHYLFNVKVPKS